MRSYLINSTDAVHPRLRGELGEYASRLHICDGSSPLTRGTLINGYLLTKLARFIPAYAGNSSAINLSVTVNPVHPRLRGELKKAKLQPSIRSGSSPLTRGTQRTERIRYRLGRFIPAYAGNSTYRRRPSASSTVHPRLRGELALSTERSKNSIGSSPLTRGTR